MGLSYSNEHIHAYFPSRIGGVSNAPYDSLNIGFHVGDDPIAVKNNREILYDQLSKDNQLPDVDNWIFLNQTHGTNIYLPDEQDYKYEQPQDSDASITTTKSLPLVVMTADCGPLVIYGQSIIGVIHASCKTISAGLIEKTINEIRKTMPEEELFGLLGPCIHPQNYEFNQDDLNDLSKHLGKHIISTTKDGKPAFDLPNAILHECKNSGIVCESMDIDTFSNEEYFSYRRDGVTGRQGVIAWLV